MMTGSIEIVAEGLGHPEGPDVLPDGRVVFANTYKSEASVWEEGKGVSTYAFTGGGPNACMLGSDGYVVPDRRRVAGAGAQTAFDPARCSQRLGRDRRHRDLLWLLRLRRGLPPPRHRDAGFPPRHAGPRAGQG